MSTTALIIGLIMVFCGIMVKKYPNLIGGYRTMPPEVRAKIDFRRIAKFLQNWLILTGAAIMVWYYLLSWIGLHLLASYYVLIPILVIPYMIMRVRCCNHNPYTWGEIVTIASIFLLMVIIAFIVLFSMRSPGVEIKDDKLVITGKYNVSRPLDNIANISLSDTVPNISYSPKGITIGTVRKGWFRSKDGQSFLMFVVSDRGPYIVITGKTGELIYLNMSTPERTLHTFNKLTREGMIQVHP